MVNEIKKIIAGEPWGVTKPKIIIFSPSLVQEGFTCFTKCHLRKGV